MTSPILLDRPIWPGRTNEARPSYWTIYRCSPTCSGHIIASDRTHEINSVNYFIDIEQFNKAMEQEFLAYEELINPSTEEGMATEGLVQEIDQAQPEEVSEGNKPSPKEKKEYISKGRFRKKPRIFGK